MQITLDHTEIEQAITEFVANQGITINGKETNVTMVAGRGANGYSATVDITSGKLIGSAETQEEPAKVEFTEEDEPATSEEEPESLFGN